MQITASPDVSTQECVVRGMRRTIAESVHIGYSASKPRLIFNSYNNSFVIIIKREFSFLKENSGFESHQTCLNPLKKDTTSKVA